MSAHAVERLTQVLAETEGEGGRDADRLRDQPHAVVQVVGNAEGGLGLCGRPMGSLDPSHHMTAPHRETIARLPTDELPSGTVIDPVCGMTVDLNTTALTLEVDGTLHGFCNSQCRRIFTNEHGAPLNA
ncbi:hypothetical protein ABZZ74_40640 [Streptomyces sp. NPDC006476]|uniref:hypothetical protein n=1 Tax=Streptomyces sp. NPDC006476 TaxID=3157175 RepID=UPI0033BBFBF0